MNQTAQEKAGSPTRVTVEEALLEPLRHQGGAAPGEARSKTGRRRTRTLVDAELVAVVDREIEKFGRRGMMIRLRRHQMLSFLVQRGVWCRCGASDRELEALDAPVPDAGKSVQIEGDPFVAGIVGLERQRLGAQNAKLRLRLSKQQMLRAIVLKGARCVCPLPDWAVAVDGPESRGSCPPRSGMS